MEEAIEAGQRESKQIEALLKENGIGLPPTPPERPKASLNDIPIGARFQDPEITAALSAHIAAGLIACSTIMGDSIREEAQLGAKVLLLKKDKGWLVPPPLHHHKADDC